MAKALNDTQLAILSNAASRDDHHVLPLPKLTAPPVAVKKTLNALLGKGFIEEVAASRHNETWEGSQQQGRTTLAITTAGLAAIGIEDETGPTKPTKGRTRGNKAGKGTKAAKSSPQAPYGRLQAGRCHRPVTARQRRVRRGDDGGDRLAVTLSTRLPVRRAEEAAQARRRVREGREDR